MRNLKRVLSLVLAAMMLIGMMAVGAGAVDTYNDFTDKDEIVNKDAVSMLVTLGVIDGKEDGSYYDPTGNVTRAEMAKMISVIMNKGSDISTLYADMNSGLTDIDGNWAKGHINFCYSQKIIAGRGDGRFAPTENVTAAEAAKMLLVAAGYDPNIEGLIGGQWSTQTSALASKLGIYDGYTKSVMATLTRDDAALLIYNALDIEMIQKYEDGYAVAFSDSRTILSYMYGVIKVQGIVTANEWAALSGDKDDAMKEGVTRIENADGILSTTTSTTVRDEANVKTATFNVSTPVELIGRNVTMYIKKATVLADSTVYGTPVINDFNEVASAGDVTNVKDFSKDNKLTLNSSTEYYNNYAEVDAADFKVGRGVAVDLIDNNGDGIVDYALSLEKGFGQITSKKSDKLTVSGLKSVDSDVVMGFDDVDKDDYVLFVQYGGRTYVQQPEVVTGLMDSYNNKNTTERYIVVDGEKYHEDVLAISGSISPVKFEVAKSETDDGVEFKKTYDYYLDDFGNIVAFKLVEGAAANYALVLRSGYNPGVYDTDATGKVTVLLPDGTKKAYNLDFEASAENFEDAAYAHSDVLAALSKDSDKGIANLKGFLGASYTDNTDTRPWVALAGGAGTVPADFKSDKAAGWLVAYSIDDDELMTIDVPELNIGTTSSPDHTELPALGNNMASGDTYFTVVEKGEANAETVGDNYYYYDKTDRTWKFDTSTIETGKKFGIDSETIVYYWDEADQSATVAVGYDSLSKVTALVDGKYDVSVKAIMVNAKTGLDGSKIAKVVVLGAKGEADNRDYCLVLNVWDRNSDTYNYYDVILADGTIATLKSKAKLSTNYNGHGVDRMVYAYSTNSDGVTVFEKVFDDQNMTNPYLLDTDGSVLTEVGAVNSGFNVAQGEVYLEGGLWVDIGDTPLQDKDSKVIYNAFDADTEESSADNIVLADKQYAVAVYKDNKIAACWVVSDVPETDTPGGPVHDNGEAAKAPTANVYEIVTAFGNDADIAKSVADGMKEVKVATSGSTIKVSGTVGYTNGFTKFNESNATEQNGNYVVLKINAPDIDGIDGYKFWKPDWNGGNGTWATSTLDGDSYALVVIRVNDKDKTTLEYQWTDNNAVVATSRYTVDFSDLVIE